MATSDNVQDLSLQVSASTELLRRAMGDAQSFMKSQEKSLGDSAQKIDRALSDIGKSGVAVGGVKGLKDLGLAANESARGLGSMRDKANQARTSLLEFEHVGRSLFDSIAAGQSPMRALVLEGGRIGEIFSSQGGAGGVIATVSKLLGGPLVIGAGLAALAIAGFTYEIMQAGQEEREFAAKLALTGNASGMTVDRFRELGDAIGKATNTGQGAGEKITRALVDAGVRGRAAIENLGIAAIDLSRVTGQSTDEIVKEFAKAQDAPGKFAEEFGKAYAILTPAQIQEIRLLDDQGRSAEAFGVLAAIMGDKLGEKVVPRLSLMGKALKEIRDTWLDLGPAISWLGQAETTGEKAASARSDFLDAQQKADDPRYSQRSDVQGTLKHARDAYYQAELADASARAKADSQESKRKIDLKGEAADQRIRGEFGRYRDPQRQYDQQVGAVKRSINDALAANPNDEEALALQARLPQVERDIHDQFFGRADKAAKPKKGPNPLTALRHDDGVQAQIDSMRRALDSATAANDPDPSARFRDESANVYAELQDKKREIADRVKDKRLNPQQAAQETELATQLAQQKAITLDIREQARLAAEKLSILQADHSNATEMLQLELTDADNSKEKRRIELKILDLAQQDAIAREQAIIASRQATEAEKLIARRRIEALNAELPLKQKQLADRTNGPGAAYAKQLNDVDIGEAIQSAEVNGLKKLGQTLDGLVPKVHLLGGAFDGLANSIISDLARIAIEQEIIKPLSNALFGGSEGGGLFSSIFGGSEAGGSALIASSSPFTDLGGAYAAGGDPPVGVPSLVGERGPELFVPRVPGTIVPNHRLGSGSDGGQTVNISVDARGSNDAASVQRAGYAGALAGYAAAQEAQRQGNRPRMAGSRGA